jgi:hypothetical protein
MSVHRLQNISKHHSRLARVVCFAVRFGVCLSCCFEFLWVGARAECERDIESLHDIEQKKGEFCYLRFLNSFVPSISVTYSKPASISDVASLMFVADLHVHSSSLRFSS